MGTMTATTAPNTCTDAASQKTLTVEEAIARILAVEHPRLEVERLPLDQALGRVLAETVASPIDQPNWDHSAMDGYALRHADLSRDPPQWSVSQRIPAGSQPEPLAPGTAARIFTGAPAPLGADTVVVQEICILENKGRHGEQLRIAPEDIARIKPGANIRQRGEDIRSGDQILHAGTRLAPQHLALAASVGLAELAVHRLLRVAILSSGDELVMPGQPLRPGQIYNSNRYMLAALLRALRCEVIDRGMIPDRFEPTLQALRAAADQADLVIASGGVSVGEEDHVRPAVEQLGSLDVARVAMRPGKPVAVGRIGHAAFIGSPGNPVSLFVTFALFARPLILKLQGQIPEQTPEQIPGQRPGQINDMGGAFLPRPQRASADFATQKPDKRREYRRARLVHDAEGQPRVQVFLSRSSAAITSLTWADGLVVIPENTQINHGDPVDFLPFSELLT
jgi:molybdopterin molybdotransferase